MEAPEHVCTRSRFCCRTPKGDRRQPDTTPDEIIFGDKCEKNGIVWIFGNGCSYFADKKAVKPDIHDIVDRRGPRLLACTTSPRQTRFSGRVARTLAHRWRRVVGALPFAHEADGSTDVVHPERDMAQRDQGRASDAWAIPGVSCRRSGDQQLADASASGCLAVDGAATLHGLEVESRPVQIADHRDVRVAENHADTAQLQL